MRVQSPGRKRLFNRIKKTGKRTLDTMDRVLETAEKVEAYRDIMADSPITQIATQAFKLAGEKKNPIGSLGLNLMPTMARQVSINETAASGITTSSSMFMYRPPRKRNVGQATQYQQKTMENSFITSSANTQTVFDLNMLDAEPVLNNPDSGAKYSNLTVRRAFDNLLLARAKRDSDGTAYDFKEEQASLHFTSLQAELKMTNQLTRAAQVEVFELVPQHDLGPSTYVDANKATGYMSPRWTFENGLAGDVIELDDDLTLTDVASNPFNSVTFSRTWKVVKRLKINLSAGASHIHKSVYQINKTVSYQKLAQVSTSGGKFEGWNPTFMVIQKGFPGAVTSGEGQEATQVSYTLNMQLDYRANATEQARVIVYDNQR